MNEGSSSSSDKATLVEKLAELLGFVDGAEDVLNHLLTIESKAVRLMAPSPDIVLAS